MTERNNRDLLQKIRVMLLEAGLNPKVLGGAVLHASYLINITPTQCNGGKTPFEILFGRVPNINKLRVSGRSTHIDLRAERRTWKLASRYCPGILLGFENGLYRI